MLGYILLACSLILVELISNGTAALPYMLVVLMANGVAQNVSPMHACIDPSPGP